MLMYFDFTTTIFLFLTFFSGDISCNVIIACFFRCSVDPYLFENFLTEDGDLLRAKFKAFKFPESNFVLFRGVVNVCLDKCTGVSLFYFVHRGKSDVTQEWFYLAIWSNIGEQYKKVNNELHMRTHQKI